MLHLAKRVAIKLEEGDFKGAVHSACSEDAFTSVTDDTLSVLWEKHPALHPASCFPSPPDSDHLASLPLVSEEDVARALRSFPRGSAGGPDGIRPQHLLDLISPSAERGGGRASPSSSHIL